MGLSDVFNAKTGISVALGMVFELAMHIWVHYTSGGGAFAASIANLIGASNAAATATGLTAASSGAGATGAGAAAAGGGFSFLGAATTPSVEAAGHLASSTASSSAASAVHNSALSLAA